MREEFFFYDANGNSVKTAEEAQTFRCLQVDDKGNTLHEIHGTVGDTEPEEEQKSEGFKRAVDQAPAVNQPIMEPSALDRIPWLQKKDTSRDYKEEYRLYQGKPHQIKERAARNKARSDMGLKVGDSREVDHKNPLSRGGSNSRRNLRVVERSTNRRKGDKAE